MRGATVRCMVGPRVCCCGPLGVLWCLGTRRSTSSFLKCCSLSQWGTKVLRALLTHLSGLQLGVWCRRRTKRPTQQASTHSSATTTTTTTFWGTQKEASPEPDSPHLSIHLPSPLQEMVAPERSDSERCCYLSTTSTQRASLGTSTQSHESRPPSLSEAYRSRYYEHLGDHSVDPVYDGPRGSCPDEEAASYVSFGKAH